MAKLTEKQRRALVWVRDHQPVQWWPLDGTAPTGAMQRLLRKLGLIEQVGTAGFMNLTGLSPAGLEALATLPQPEAGQP